MATNNYCVDTEPSTLSQASMESIEHSLYGTADISPKGHSYKSHPLVFNVRTSVYTRQVEFKVAQPKHTPSLRPN